MLFWIYFNHKNYTLHSYCLHECKNKKKSKQFCCWKFTWSLVWLDRRNATHKKSLPIKFLNKFDSALSEWCFRFDRNDGSPFRLFWKTLLWLERSDTSHRVNRCQVGATSHKPNQFTILNELLNSLWWLLMKWKM